MNLLNQDIFQPQSKMSTACPDCNSHEYTTFVTVTRGRIYKYCDKHLISCGVLVCPHCGDRHPTTVGAEKWQQEHECTAHRELIEHFIETPENIEWWCGKYPDLAHHHEGYGWCWYECEPDHYHPCYSTCKEKHSHSYGEPCWEEDCRRCPGCGGRYDGADYGGRGCSRRCAYGGWGGRD